jgi:hypothetical protein
LANWDACTWRRFSGYRKWAARLGGGGVVVNRSGKARSHTWINGSVGSTT